MSSQSGPSPVVFASVDTLAPVGPPAPAEWQQQLEQEREQARAEGYQEGMQEALRLLDLAQQALNSGEQERHALLALTARRLEREALAMALAMAERLTHHHFTEQAEAVLPVVTHALDFVTEAEQITLHLNPQELSLVEAAVGDGRLQVTAQLRLRANPEVAPGGCRVESDAGDIDATRETRLSQLHAKLDELRGERDVS